MANPIKPITKESVAIHCVLLLEVFVVASSILSRCVGVVAATVWLYFHELSLWVRGESHHPPLHPGRSVAPWLKIMAKDRPFIHGYFCSRQFISLPPMTVTVERSLLLQPSESHCLCTAASNSYSCKVACYSCHEIIISKRLRQASHLGLSFFFCCNFYQ